MSVKFSLNIIIEGDTLDQIDEGLIKAATQRLVSRIQTGPQKMGTVVDKPAELPVGLDLKISKEIDENIAEQNQMAAKPSEKPSEIHEEKRKPGRPKKVEDLPATTPPPTRDDAVRALSLINEKFGIDKARECLTKFEIKRLAELDNDKIPSFIEHCQALAK